MAMFDRLFHGVLLVETRCLEYVPHNYSFHNPGLMTGNRPFMTQRKELAAAKVLQLNRRKLPADQISSRTGSSHRVRGVNLTAINHGDVLSSICGGSYCPPVSNAVARGPGQACITGD